MRVRSVSAYGRPHCPDKQKIPCHVCAALRTAVQKKTKDLEHPGRLHLPLLFQRPLHPDQTANPDNEILNPKQTSYLEIRYSKLILIGMSAL
jgi:hypothetical protein